MDAAKGQNTCGKSRSRMLLIPLCALLAGSLSGNIWQYRVAAEKRLQAEKAEQTAIAKASEARREAEQKKLKRAGDAKTDERVQQLYREIDTLTRLNEQFALPKQSQSSPANTDDLPLPVDAP